MKQEKMMIRSLSILVVWILVSAVFLGMLNVGENTEASGFRMNSFLSDSHASFWGEDPGDESGYSVAGAGDVNGDGYDDILIGAPLDNDVGSEAGKAYLIFGKLSGWAMDTSLSKVDASFLGEDAGDWAGYSVAGAGDVNGDGYDDILIGAPYDEEGGSIVGQTYLIFGKDSGWTRDLNLTYSDASFWGEDRRSGWSVAGAGDVNGDGYDDILIGEKYNGDGGFEAGKTYLILGRESGWAMNTSLSNANASFRGEDTDDRSGYSVAGAGDVNGDGFDDILIGAPNDEEGDSGAGQTYLIFGKSSGWLKDTDLSDADASFLGEDADDESGISVAGAGDVNGDGYYDILIGAHYDEEGGGAGAGQTYLIFGKVSGWAMDTNLSTADASFLGEDGDDLAGFSVAGAGNLNGDRYDDILIGAPLDEGNGSMGGQTYLILGKASGWAMDVNLSNADASFLGEDTGDQAGHSIAGAGDVNGDGYDDILIGARRDEESGVNAGQTYLIFYESTPTIPLNLEAQLSRDGSEISLSWEANPYWKDLTGYNIYKSNDGTYYYLYDSVDNTTLSYIDRNVEIGKTYRYKVTAISYPELESQFSNIVEILNEPDSDMDSIGDTYDPDDDEDGVLDVNDAFPLDPTEDSDFDNDGIGNNSDPDDDNDGIPDTSDSYPLNPFNDLETFLRTQLADLAVQHTAIEDAITSISGVVENENELTRSEILDKINESISQIQSLNTNATIHDSDIKAILNSLNALIGSEHELTKAQLLENLTDILDQLDIVESNILGDIDEVNQSLDSLEGETDDSEEDEDSISMIVMIVLVLVILALIISVMGIALTLKGNSMLRQALRGELKGTSPSKEELENEAEKKIQ